VLFKGKPLALKSEVEEICNWWAHEQGSEFAEKDTVKKNFTQSFLALFKVELGDVSIDDFDFTPIK